MSPPACQLRPRRHRGQCSTWKTRRYAEREDCERCELVHVSGVTPKSPKIVLGAMARRARARRDPLDRDTIRHARCRGSGSARRSQAVAVQTSEIEDGLLGVKARGIAGGGTDAGMSSSAWGGAWRWRRRRARRVPVPARRGNSRRRRSRSPRRDMPEVVNFPTPAPPTSHAAAIGARDHGRMRQLHATGARPPREHEAKW